MTELRVLPTWPRERAEDVVTKLRDLLARAEAGEITGIAYATTQADGAVGSGWTKHDDYGKLLGAVTRLQIRLASD